MQSIFTHAKIKFFLFFIFTLLYAHSQAQPISVRQQEVNVTFKIMNQKREPVSFASVTAINRTDSLQTIKETADSLGLIVFKLSAGQYLIKISSVNYQPVEKGITVSANQTFFNFTAESLPKTLGNVTVSSQKPLMKQEDDKTIVDPENLVASSTSGYEVIEKNTGPFC
jgi:hypothetical protein